jgi:hypothetical protein
MSRTVGRTTDPRQVTDARPIVRADGVTAAERYLKRLCDRTFLSLWSHAGVYRDQDGGKEVADLLVVFDDHVVIFSDKDCAFPDTGDAQVDWSRWYRKAIAKSAEQVFGAERWIGDHPDRLFLDRACTQRFPLPLPDPSAAKVHRVVVAHGVAERCQRELRGSGGLRIIPDIVGAEHVARPEDGGRRFAIGQVDPARGYVHVLDDASLDTVMAELDTVSDFVAYLSEKERLILEGRLLFAASEADLLASYLYPIEGKDRSGFLDLPGVDRLSISEGLWDAFDREPHRAARRDANAVSYLWDGLIEASAGSVIANTQYFATRPGIRGGADALRVPAREPRTARRLLSVAFRDLVLDTPVRQNFRAQRILAPTEPDQPYYAFLLLSPTLSGFSRTKYREFRRYFLEGLCEVVKLEYPDAEDIVGIATELGDAAGRSQDVVYRNARVFTEEDRANARQFAKAHRLGENVVRTVGTEYDYPHPDNPGSSMPFLALLPRPPMKGRNRNAPCPCGSGRKFKRCCGVSAPTAV